MEDETSLIDQEFTRQARELGVATTREVRSIGYYLARTSAASSISTLRISVTTCGASRWRVA